MVNDPKARGLPGFVDKEGRKSNEPDYHNPGPSAMDIPVSEREISTRKRKKRDSEGGGVFDVLFGDGVGRMQQRNIRRAVLFKYITIWATLILAFSAFLIWRFL